MAARYGGSLTAILADTFPELFQAATSMNFLSPLFLWFHTYLPNMDLFIEPEGYWDNIEHRKEFLSSFAAKGGFDPLQGENWLHKLPQLRGYGVPHALTHPIPSLLVF